jgi:hypothetical protein
VRQHNWIAGFERYLKLRRGKIRADILKWQRVLDWTEAKWR